MKRRIKKANITFISLCPRGKNLMPTIYKEDGTVEFNTLLKDDTFKEKGELIAVVYAPEIRDTDGDIASAEVIKQMAYDYMKDGGELDVRHDGKALTKAQAYIAETFLIQKDDPRFRGMKTNEGTVVDVTGGWAMVVKVDDPDLRKAYGEDGWGGVSIFGKAQVVIEDDKVAEESLDRIVKALANRLAGNPADEEIDMTKEEMAQVLKESNGDLSKSIVDGLVAALKKEPGGDDENKGKGNKSTADDKIEFEGDIFDADDLKAHIAKVEKAKLLKGLDLSDPKALNLLLTSMEKSKDDDKGKNKESEEVETLRKQLKTALKKSGQPAQKGKGENEEEEEFPTGLSKEEADCFALGRKMGNHSNTLRGYATKK